MAVPNTFVAGSTLSASAVNENFSYLDGRISSLNQDNFAAGTRIPNANLANSNTVVPLQIHLGPNQWVSGTSGYAQGSVSIPYDSTEGAASYTFIAGDVQWRHNGPSSPGTCSLDWGYFVPSGAAASAFTVITQVALFTLSTVSAPSCGSLAISGLPVTVATSAGVRGCFAIRSQTVSGQFSTAGDHLVCDLKLIRALRG